MIEWTFKCECVCVRQQGRMCVGTEKEFALKKRKSESVVESVKANSATARETESVCGWVCECVWVGV